MVSRGARMALAAGLALSACAEEEPCVAWEADVTLCYDEWCADIETPYAFCDCWIRRLDLNPITCVCMKQDLQTACHEAGLEDYQPGTFHCEAAREALGNLCAYEMD
ncbi:MAG: hypothetical protein JXB39_08655 [Deltaproteobacteria bacterium]|nr:hypothetical protein [Deltaproteobacteria bacterium]